MTFRYGTNSEINRSGSGGSEIRIRDSIELEKTREIEVQKFQLLVIFTIISKYHFIKLRLFMENGPNVLLRPQSF